MFNLYACIRNKAYKTNTLSSKLICIGNCDYDKYTYNTNNKKIRILCGGELDYTHE